MAFRFPLATVLRVRESLEKKEERALQQIQVEIAGTVNQIDTLSAEIEQSHRAREKTMQQSVSAAQLQMLISAVRAAEEKKKALQAHLFALEEKRLQQVLIYQAAHRDREMLTDMSSRQRDAYDLDKTRREQKSLDDIFMARRQQF